MPAADAIVIGAGASGLVDAILLAERGWRVVVLEQHTIPGGYLQQFRRKKTVFDVGFHYMGSTAPGRPMRQFLEHLQVWDRLRLRPFPLDAAIEVRTEDVRWAFPARWDRFVDAATTRWPAERSALEAFAGEVDAVCGDFRWFGLRRDRHYRHPLDLDHPTHSFAAHVAERFDDPSLLEVLGAQSFNLGLFPEEIPWVKHALAFRSNFDTTSRIDGGGGALVDALVARGRALGVTYRFGEGVEAFEVEGRRVQAVRTAKDRYEAPWVLAAVNPKVVMERLTDAQLRPLFKERILDMPDARGAVQVFVRLRERLDSLQETCVLVTDPVEAQGDPPIHAVLVTVPDGHDPDPPGGPRLEAMTYMDMAPFARWRGTRAFKRGADYDACKRALQERVLKIVARVAPELPERIADVYASTPLTDLWYTLNPGGAVFGISHEVGLQGLRRPQPRTRLKNVLFTGHSIQMPGICGVFINAFATCAELRDDDLFAQVATG